MPPAGWPSPGGDGARGQPNRLPPSSRWREMAGDRGLGCTGMHPCAETGHVRRRALRTGPPSSGRREIAGDGGRSWVGVHPCAETESFPDGFRHGSWPVPASGRAAPDLASRANAAPPRGAAGRRAAASRPGDSTPASQNRASTPASQNGARWGPRARWGPGRRAISPRSTPAMTWAKRQSSSRTSRSAAPSIARHNTDSLITSFLQGRPYNETRRHGVPLWPLWPLLFLGISSTLGPFAIRVPQGRLHLRLTSAVADV